jgi:hypothetical protein
MALVCSLRNQRLEKNVFLRGSYQAQLSLLGGSAPVQDIDGYCLITPTFRKGLSFESSGK